MVWPFSWKYNILLGTNGHMLIEFTSWFWLEVPLVWNDYSLSNTQILAYMQKLYLWLGYSFDFPGGTVVKNPPANARDVSSISGSRRSPGGGNGNPFQCSCLENAMDRGAWRATVHRKSRTRLSAETQRVPFGFPHISSTFVSYSH